MIFLGHYYKYASMKGNVSCYVGQQGDFDIRMWFYFSHYNIAVNGDIGVYKDGYQSLGSVLRG